MKFDTAVFHVSTQEDYNGLMIELEYMGYTWVNKKRPTENNIFKDIEWAESSNIYASKDGHIFRLYNDDERNVDVIEYKFKPNLPSWVEWLARDANGILWGFQEEPIKNHLMSCWQTEDDFEYKMIRDDVYSSIKWEDKKPYRIKHSVDCDVLETEKSSSNEITKEQFMAYAEEHNLVVFDLSVYDESVQHTLTKRILKSEVTQDYENRML